MRINTKEKRGRQDKKGVSEVLATILIVLFVIAALVIVSVVLFQFIRSKSEEITAGCVSIDIAITKAEYNQTGNITMVYVKRAGGDAEMTGMKFIFNGKEKMPSEESDNAALKILETGRYIFNNITSKPKKIEAAPIVKTEAEKEMNCGIKAIIREKDIVEKSISTSAPAPSSPQFQDIRTGLIAEWKFDELSGTTASDSSGNNNHGSLINGPVWTTGKKGNALSFDGSDDYVWLGNPASLQIANPTIVAWFKTFSASLMQIYRWRTYGFEIGMQVGKVYFAYTDSTATAYVADSPSVYNDGSWHHAVGTYDGNVMRLYVDGQLVKSVSTTAAIYYGAGGAAIGRAGDFSGNYFNGLIDEVRVYNRVLSSEEVSQLYQSG